MVSNIFYFHPYLGKIPIFTNIFQMGWNHQPDLGPITILSFGERARIPIVFCFSFPLFRVYRSPFFGLHLHMCQGRSTPIISIKYGMVINPIVGVYTPIIRIPIKSGMTIPNIATFDHGTHVSIGTRDLGLLRHSIQIRLDTLRVPSVECRVVVSGFRIRNHLVFGSEFP